MLRLEARPVDRSGVEPGRRSRLESAKFESVDPETLCQTDRRLLTESAGRDPRIAEVDDAAKKRSRRQDDGETPKRASVAKFDALDSSVLGEDLSDLAFDDREISHAPDQRLHLATVSTAIGLHPRTLHCWAFAAIKETKLNRRSVGGLSHQSVECIDFPDQVAFPEAADRRIAGHFPNAGKMMGDERGGGSAPRRCGGCFAAGVAAADDYNVKVPHSGTQLNAGVDVLFADTQS